MKKQEKRMERLARCLAQLSLDLLLIYFLITTQAANRNIVFYSVIGLFAIRFSIRNNTGNRKKRRFHLYIRSFTNAFAMGKPWIGWYYFKKDDAGNTVDARHWKFYVS